MFKFTKIANTEINEQRVISDGTEIGTVWRAWFRYGGDGWTNSLIGSGNCPTRKEAARDLLRRYKKLHKETT